MVDWNPVAILPNVTLEEPIEGRIASLVPQRDDRINSLVRVHPNFRAFLRKFTDPFGVKLHPSVLMVRTDAPRSIYTVEALANFRDLIALSVVLYNRARELTHQRGHRVLWGDTFSFYPWMIDRNFNHLLGQTPAILSMHDVVKFLGQSSPDIFPMTLRSSEIDWPMLRELLERWTDRYTSRRPGWSDIALFRSLNMAHKASLLPAASDTTLYDIGRSIMLWVSAFETLVHPGGNGQANLRRVFDLIETVQWDQPLSRFRRFKTGTKNLRARRTLASWLYGVLYTARNDFVHGNPVCQRTLVLKGSRRNLFDYAGPLYRLALTAFLPLSFTSPVPRRQNAAEFGQYMAERLNFLSFQRTIEEGLLTARQNPRD